MTRRPIGYSVGHYRDPDTGRARWAVLGPGDVWYFASHPGNMAAHALCRRMNRAEQQRTDPTIATDTLAELRR